MMNKLTGLLCLALISLTFSCSSDSDSSTTTIPGATLSADVDGQSWASLEGGALANLVNVGEGHAMLQVIGVKMDQSAISVQIPAEDLAEGTYTYDSESMASLMYTAPGGTNAYTNLGAAGGTFTVTITDLNLATGRISGTFSGTLYDFDENSISITNGVMNSISIMNTGISSNGSMSLSRNGGTVFTMDGTQDDGKFLMVIENEEYNSISLAGNNATLTSDMGIYSVTMPLDVAAGTYDLTEVPGFTAGIGNGDGEVEYNLSSGTMTVTSHSGNTISGTFSFTAFNGTQTVTITNGTFTVTHQ